MIISSWYSRTITHLVIIPFVCHFVLADCIGSYAVSGILHVLLFISVFFSLTFSDVAFVFV